MVKLKWLLFLVLGAFLLFSMVIIFFETANDNSHRIPVPFIALDEELQKVQKRMEGRKEKLKQVCSNEQITKKSSATKAMNQAWHMTQVLKDHQLMMCVVHKAGSSTWNTIMARLYNKENLIKTGNMYKMISMLRPEKEVYNTLIDSPEFFKVVMARNPFERVLSGFRNRIDVPGLISGQTKKYVPGILFYNRGIRYNKTDIFHNNGSLKIFPTFSEFISYLVTLDPESYDPHWKPVFIQCGVCHVNYDAVLLTETFSKDLRYIMVMTGLDKIVDSTLTSKHLNKADKDTRQLLASYYSTLKPEVLRKFIKIYQMDFELFNYDPNVIFSYFSSSGTQDSDKVDERFN